MKSIKTLFAVIVGVAGLGITTVPTQASPLQSLVLTQNDAQLVQVSERHRRNFYYYPGDYDDRGRHFRNRDRGNSFYLNGFRGESHRRHGYRYYNGYYFPPNAFNFSINIR